MAVAKKDDAPWRSVVTPLDAHGSSKGDSLVLK
jgi:hypothetical protein